MASLPFPAIPNPQNFHFQFTKPKKSIQLTQTHFSKPHDNNFATHHTLYKSYFHHISSLCKDGQIQEAVELVTEMQRKKFHIGPEIYGELLQGCVYERALLTGQQLHARILKHGALFSRNEYIETKLLIFYAKCDLLDASKLLFRRLRVHNVFSWAAVIGLNCRLGFLEETLLGFCEMLENGVFPDNFVVPNALKACGALRWLRFGKGVHGYVAKMGFADCVYVATSLIDVYGKCGVSDDARMVFDKMPERNVIAWNSMVVSYLQNGMSQEAMEIFSDMREEGLELTRVTVASFLSASANLHAVEEGRQCHGVAILSGLELDNFLGSSVMNFYSKVGLVEDAELAFSKILEKDVVIWNLLISAYVQHGKVNKALDSCHKMRSENFRFDCVTLASILAAASITSNIRLGKEAHCFCIRNKLDLDLVVASCILDMYSNCGKIVDARRVFDSATVKDIIFWNTMLAAYAEFSLSGEALKLFYQMQLEGVPPNTVSWNSVIFGFLKNGQISEAKDMFEQMQALGVSSSIVTWTTMISGLAQNGHSIEAILVFNKMQESGIKPNSFSITSILSACTDLASLLYGRSIHGYIIRRGYRLTVQISTGLVDMYAKCGNINKAKRVFDMFPCKELPLCNAMIYAYALHGQANEALELYKCLNEADNITYTNILSACDHAGMLNEGLEIFSDMTMKHGIKPAIEHYGCVVNLLSRHGLLNEALRFVHDMPFDPDPRIIGSLFAREDSDVKVREYLMKHLMELEPENPGNLVALSNVYAGAKMWDKVSAVRDLMKEKGLRKTTGCSWIQIGEELHVFVSGDAFHSEAERISVILALVTREMCLGTEEVFF